MTFGTDQHCPGCRCAPRHCTRCKEELRPPSSEQIQKDITLSLMGVRGKQPTTDLYERYVALVQAQERPATSPIHFGRTLSAMGFTPGRSGNVKYWTI